MTLFDYLVPTPVTSLSVSDVSTITITVNWTSPSSEDGNYVTYYNISYSPSCPELLSVNVTLVSVTPHQSAITSSYILRELFSGMNYTMTVRAGNILGESSSVMILGETDPISGKCYFYCLNYQLNTTLEPTGSIKLIVVSTVNLTSNRITWEEIDCHLRNGRIIEYIVIISNNSMAYNLTSSERYVIVNDLVFGNVYNMSVAGVNSIGRGPFSDPIEVQIGTSKYIVSSSEQQSYFVLSSWSS